MSEGELKPEPAARSGLNAEVALAAIKDRLKLRIALEAPRHALAGSWWAAQKTVEQS